MRRFITLILPVVLSACTTIGPSIGSYLPGQIYSIENGKHLDFEIEVSFGKGKVRATENATGEVFNGTYVAVSGGSTTIGTGVGRIGDTTATTISGVQKSINVMATSSAILFGDQGSVLDCSMRIQRGHVPKGIGTCVDKQGVLYKLMF
jgi:hypothetical protein